MKKFFVIVLLVLALGSCNKPEIPETIFKEDYQSLLSTNTAIVPVNKGAWTINSELGQGINLGDIFERNETYGEVATRINEEVNTGKRVAKIAEQGFKHIRLPINWNVNNRTGSAPNYTINPDFFTKVKKVVDHILAKKMRVIINMHNHSELNGTPGNELKSKFLSQWQQIANTFKDYSDSVVFEIINEPKFSNSSILNEFIGSAITTIRATGGNNLKRIIMITPNGGGSMDDLAGLAFPSGENYKLILTLHDYSPATFTHSQTLQDVWLNTNEDRLFALNKLMLADSFSKKYDVPINIGEFGSNRVTESTTTMSEERKHSRKYYANYMNRTFRSKGYSTTYWCYDDLAFGIIEPHGNYNKDNTELMNMLRSPVIAGPSSYPGRSTIFANAPSVNWRVIANTPGFTFSKSLYNTTIEATFGTITGIGKQEILISKSQPLDAGKTYALTFKGKSKTTGKLFSVRPINCVVSYSSGGTSEGTNLWLTDNENNYAYVFKGSAGNATLKIYLVADNTRNDGGGEGTITIKDISLIRLD